MPPFPPALRWARLWLLLIGLVLALPAARAGIPVIDGGQPVPSLAPMLEKVTPAVVNISTKTRIRVRDPFFDDPMFREFFGLPPVQRERVEQSLGSGVIVDAAKGYVLTNNHVVGGADDITVTLQDGRNLKGRLVGTDPDTDVAVVQISAPGLTALSVADSNQLRVGDFVLAVGNPFGLGQTVTSGIVSALGRSGLGGLGYQNFIQTDASINPGNSGGALINLRGELVGINTMIFSPSGGNVGIGFAIPSNLARDVMGQLIAYGKVRRGSLGVLVQDLNPRLARLLGVKTDTGVVVTEVVPGSAADRAGIEPGDVLTTLNGKPLRSADELRNQEGLLPLGSTLKLGLIHEGNPREVSATLAPVPLATLDGGKLDQRLAGVRFSELPLELRNQGAAGVAVQAVRPGSRAAQAGLREGDVVIGVGNHRITGLRDLQRMLGAGLRQLVLIVADEEGAHYVLLD
ncbi:Do family serine endopeptidase [Aerosticca soli]|uniref:HtrA protease/chaperone protein n=1 Tax=Aerosticca soli TaxID=2010829 RepID=A0A2Z6E6W4_9GAMM|nr:Do family serine endopeptidase [Aerosticca soli]BBD80843.1 HtrA protease/chaperone protein [Aerosticca soli]